MKRVAKRHNEVHIASRRQNPCYFGYDLLRIMNMFEHGITLDALKYIRQEGQARRVRRHIDSRYCE